MILDSKILFKGDYNCVSICMFVYVICSLILVLDLTIFVCCLLIILFFNLQFVSEVNAAHRFKCCMRCICTVNSLLGLQILFCFFFFFFVFCFCGKIYFFIISQ